MRSFVLELNEKNRVRLAWAVIVLAPLAASVMEWAAYSLSVRTFASTFLHEASPFLSVATSPLAAIGPAAAALLLRGSLGYRVTVGMVCGVLGYIAYWVVSEPVGWLFGFSTYAV